MIRKQDLGVLFLDLIGYSKIRQSLFRLRKRPVVRIIAFHDIPHDSYGRFKDMMRLLQRDTNVVSLDDHLAGRLTFDKINTVITFDDGYQGWIRHAIPVLKEMRFPATFFITSGFVGLSKEHELDFAKRNLFRTIAPRTISGGLSQNDVRLIVGEGFSLGGHTLSHCDLSNISEAERAKHEIAEDKLILERISGIRIEYFAYPMGGCDNPYLDLSKALKELGFKAAVTTVPGFNLRNSNPYLLHRDLTDVSLPARVFRAKISGNYDAIDFIKKLFARVFRKNDVLRLS